MMLTENSYLVLPLSDNSNCTGALCFRFAMSCLVRKTLSGEAFEGKIGALFVVDAQLGAGILAEIELGQIAIQMFDINVLVNTDKASLQDGEKAFQRVGVSLATGPLEFGMIDHLMIGNRSELVARGGVGHERAFVVHVLADDSHGAAVVKHGRANIATTFHKAHDDGIVRFAAEVSRTLGLAGSRQLGFVGLHYLTCAAQRVRGRQWGHRKANAVPKVPRGFHAAAKDTLKLTGRYAFLGRAKQMDSLKPKSKGKLAVLENRAYPHRERLPTGVAFPQARTGRFATQDADFRHLATVRANRTIGPKLGLNIGKSSGFIVESFGGKNRLGHGLSPMARI